MMRRPGTVLFVALGLSLPMAAGVVLGASVPAAGTTSVQALGLLGPFGQDGSGTGLPAGRVVDLAADPFSAKHLLAVSQSALWQSQDGGNNWTQLPGLDRYGEWQFNHASLAFDPARQGTVLMTAPADDQVVSHVGVYRSTDGGLTWSRPRGDRPPCAFGPQTVVFRKHSAAVAGNCGIGVSTDDGANWSWTSPDSGGGFDGVAWDVAGNIEACGTDGVFLRQAAHPTSWSEVVDFRGTGFADFTTPGSPCRIIASPNQAQHVFFTARWHGYNPYRPFGDPPYSQVLEAWGSSVSRWTFHNLQGPSHNNGRDVTLQTRPAGTGFYLYWGTTDQTVYELCGPAAATAQCPTGQTADETQPDPPWGDLGQGNPGLHADQTRVLFNPIAPYCIRMIASDGGIQRPASGDCNGTTTGYTWSDNGISATESYQMGLTNLVGSKATDIYLATQDDGAFSLVSGTWNNVDGGDDGFSIQASPNVPSDAPEQAHVYYSSDGRQWIGQRGLTGLLAHTNTATPFTSPWDGLLGNDLEDYARVPTQLAQLSDGTLVLADTQTGGAPRLFSSADGTTWTQSSASLSALSLGNGGVEIQAAADGGGEAVVRDQEALNRVIDITGSAVAQPLMTTEAVGPFAVGDVNHLIAFGCDASFPESCRHPHVFTSTDGGASVIAQPVLERLLTHDAYGNTYALSSSYGDPFAGQPTAFAISPLNNNIMVAGARDAGLFQTGDAGSSWERIPSLPQISKLRFASDGLLYGTTYGRGAFRYLPQPATLHITSGQLNGNLVYSAQLLGRDSAPMPNVTVVFLNISASGHTTSISKAVTDSKGEAQLVNPATQGGYVVARVAKQQGILDLESQTSVFGK